MTEETGTAGAAGAAIRTAPPPAPTDGPVMRSPAGRLHAALGARFAVEAGWEIPASYGDPETERALLRDAIAVCDISARGKIDVRGLVDPVLPAGGEGTVVARISYEWALVLVSPEALPVRLRELEASAEASAAMVTDASHLYAGFALAGPRLPDLLARLTSWNPETLAPGAAAGAPLAEIRAVLVRRELPVPFIEAYVASEFGRYAWETFLQTARSLGGGAVGWDALRRQGWS